MKRLFAGVFCGVVLLGALGLGDAIAAQKDEDAAAFIRSLGRQVLETLSDTRLSPQDRTRHFYILFQKSFDGDRISAFALGKYRQAVPPENRDEYRELFGKYLTGLYATKFARYSGETFVVTDARTIASGESEVSAEIRRQQGEPIRLNFRIDGQGNEHKIYDVVIEGVSLLSAKRQEVTSVIARDGMEQLLVRLRKAVQLAGLQ